MTGVPMGKEKLDGNKGKNCEKVKKSLWYINFPNWLQYTKSKNVILDMTLATFMLKNTY